MTAYYNEHDEFAGRWLYNLAARGAIADGDVDIGDLRTIVVDLSIYRQCHFFAGIGVWSYALRLAGWSDDVPVWTGSCPCQPFSQAGRRKGFSDERHLWPDWYKLICKYRPPVIFGEQVASADGLNWLDHVQADLENADYAVGAADLPAAGVGAPHKRQRLYFVAHAPDQRRAWLDALLRARATGWFAPELPQATGRGEARGGDVADAGIPRSQRRDVSGNSAHKRIAGTRCMDSDAGVALGDTCITGSGRDAGAVFGAQARGSSEWGAAGDQPYIVVPAGATRGFWADCEWLPCSDGKARCVEPGTFPLAAGAPARVGRLRAYGNAINAEVAATFIRAAVETLRALP